MNVPFFYHGFWKLALPLYSLVLYIPAEAGILSHLVDLQMYRDFAENKGIFIADADKIVVRNKNGVVIGTIEHMMNLDGVADAHAGEAALVGGPGFIATVSHDYDNAEITFAKRFGATSGTPFYDSYRTVSVSNGWGDQLDYNYDYRVQRLSKIVTEATAAAYLTDREYLDHMSGRLCVRVGSGTQQVAYPGGVNETIAGGYAYLTGGTLRFEGQAKLSPALSPVVIGNARTYEAYRFWYYYDEPSADSPMNIGIRAGDSGSPCYFYNPKTDQWEWLGAGQSGGGEGYGGFSQMRSGNFWAVDLISSYDRTFSSISNGGNVIWNVPGTSSGNGTIVQGGNTLNYVGLASGFRGDTSTNGNKASNDMMDACHNLVFGGAGGKIVLQGSVDMGAGSLTFNSDYTLSNGGVAARRLNSAGFVVNKGAVLTTELTGAPGDEWRKIGEGTLIVAGSGNNSASLNVGGEGLVVLNRTGGAAAESVKLNGGNVIVRLMSAGQIRNGIVFGHRGGILDLYGTDMAVSTITHLDNGAVFANLKPSSTSTWTYSGGTSTYLGSFTDGGSSAAGLLNVVVAPSSEQAVWTLSGDVDNRGSWAVNGGTLSVDGSPTIHAAGYVDPNDWQDAVFNTGNVSVKGGALFRAGAHSIVHSHIYVSNSGSYAIRESSLQKGDIVLQGSLSAYLADIRQGAARQEGQVTGAGLLTKTGTGTLVLAGERSSMSGSKKVSEGLVKAVSLQALGTGIGDWLVEKGGVLGVDNTEIASVLNRIDETSTGTYVLNSGKIDNVPLLSDWNDLNLGTADATALGTLGTTDSLAPWTTDGGWRLGGGGGELTLNLKLSGSGTLYVGNGANSGRLILTNIYNSDAASGFDGNIVLSSGMELFYTDIRALGSKTKNILVEYGNGFDLGNSSAEAMAHVHGDSSGILYFGADSASDYNFGSLGLNSVALGTTGKVTLSGTLTSETGGFRFGGSGTLTIVKNLSGTGGLVFDSQGLGTGGILVLQADNSYRGKTEIYSGMTLQVGSGGSTGTLGGGEVLNEGNLVFNRTGEVIQSGAIDGGGVLTKKGSGTLVLTGANLYKGGTLIEEGILRIGNGMASGSAGSGDIVNNAMIVFDRTGNFRVDASISGTGSLVKNQTGTMSLAHSTYSGGTTVNGGILELGKYNIGSEGMIRGILTINSSGRVNLKSGDSLGYNGDNKCVSTINLNGGTLYLVDSGNQTFKKTVFNLTGGVIDGVSSGNFDVWTDSVIRVKASAKSSEIANVALKLRDENSTRFEVDDGAADADLLVSSRIINSNAAVGAFTKAGAGTMVLTGTNTYTGTTTIINGTLRLGNGGTTGKLGSGSVVNDSILEINRSNEYVLANAVSGKGDLVQNGTGTLVVSGMNTYGGKTVIRRGILSVGEGGTTGSLGSGSIENDSILRWNRSDTVSLNNAISGTGSLSKIGSGTLALNGVNLYREGTILSAGRLVAGSASAFGLGGIYLEGGTLDLNGKTTNNDLEVRGTASLLNAGFHKGSLMIGKGGALTVSGTARADSLLLDQGSVSGGILEASVFIVRSGTVSSRLSGAGTLNKEGSGTVTLGGSQTYSGVTTVADGLLNVAGSLENSSVTVRSGAVLDVSGSVWKNITIEDGGSLRTNATGMVLRPGQTLAAGHASGTWNDIAGSLSTTEGAVLDVNGTLDISGSLTFNGGNVLLGINELVNVGGTLTVLGTTDLTLDLGNYSRGEYDLMDYLALSGDISLLQLTDSSVVRSGKGRTDYYLRGDAGTLKLIVDGSPLTLAWSAGNGIWEEQGDRTWIVSGAGDSHPDSRFYTGDNVVFDSAGQVTIRNTVTPGSVLATTSGNVTFLGTGMIAGAGSLTMSGSGTLTMNTSNSYSGGTVLTAGRLVAGGGLSFGSSAISLQGGILDLNGKSVANALNVRGTGALMNARAFRGTLTAIYGTLSISGVAQAASLVVDGGNVSGGSLSADAYELRSGNVGTVLTGLAGLSKTGTGTATLSGTQLYSGTTVVEAGKLVLSGNSSIVSDVNVQSGGIFAMQGKALGDLNIHSGGRLDLTGNTDWVLENGNSLNAGRTGTAAVDISGNLKMGQGGEIHVADSAVGKMTIDGDLVLGGGTLCYTSAGGILDLVDVKGTLSVTGQTMVDIDVTLTCDGIYTLLTYGGLAGELNLLGVQDKGTRSEYIVSSSEGNKVLLTVIGKAEDLSWDAGGSGSMTWGVLDAGDRWGGTSNPDNAFHNGDRVSIVNGGTLTVVGRVEPGRVIVSGNKNVCLTGTGSLVGGGKLVKTGFGVLEVGVRNEYTGGTVLEQGGLLLTVDSALGVGPLQIADTLSGRKTVTLDRPGGGTIRMQGDIDNEASNALVLVADGTAAAVEGSLINRGTLETAGNLSIAGLVAHSSSQTILQAGSNLTSGSETVLKDGASLLLKKGNSQQKSTGYYGDVSVGHGGTLILEASSGVEGDVRILSGGVVRVSGETTVAGNYSLEQGGNLTIAGNSVLKGNVSVCDGASMVLGQGSGVFGALVLNDSSKLSVAGNTALTGDVVLTGRNQLDIANGAVLGANLKLATGAEYTMRDGLRLGASLMAENGSNLTIDGFVKLGGDFVVLPGVSQKALFLNFRMTDAMMQADAVHPVLSLGDGASFVQMPGGLLAMRLDLSGVSESLLDVRPVVVSPGLSASGQAVLDGGKLDILFRDGRITTVTRDIFAYLSGAPLPNPDDGSRAPVGIGEITSNTLWSTTLELGSMADSIRGRDGYSRIRMGDSRRGGSVWMTTVSHFFNLSDDGILHGYDYQAHGLNMGADWNVDGRWSLGASFGTVSGKNKMSGGLGDSDQDVMSGALYADVLCFAKKRDVLILSTVFGYAASSVDGVLQSPDLAGDACKGSWDGSAWMFDMRADWIHAVSERTHVNIFAGFQYIDASQDDFSLKGSRYTYDFRDVSMSVLRARLGAGISHATSLAGKGVTLHAEAAVLPDIARDAPEARVSANGAIPWAATGSEPGNVALRLEVSAACALSPDWTLSARYRIEAADKSTNQSAGIGASFTF